jgi:hypothetical protein
VSRQGLGVGNFIKLNCRFLYYYIKQNMRVEIISHIYWSGFYHIAYDCTTAGQIDGMKDGLVSSRKQKGVRLFRHYQMDGYGPSAMTNCWQ